MTGSRLDLLISFSTLSRSCLAIMCGTTLCDKILSELLVIIRSIKVDGVEVTLVGLFTI